ncbi:MAG: FkbM family methyltransferase [Gemmatimonadetes bacterium]|nr:FkbM family methyltransferase [Gemmatimonadota bacterium]
MSGVLLAPRQWTDEHAIVRFLRFFRVYDLAAGIYHRTLGLILWLRHPQTVRPNRTGTLTVHDVSFRMYDPDLLYLPGAVAGKTYEPSVTWHLRSILAPGMTFVDAGAEFGFYTCFAGSVPFDLAIHAFEPNGAFFRTLSRNVALNGIEAGLHRLALSDERGAITFSDRSMAGEGPAKKEIVSAVPFDEWAEEHGVAPDVIKIDVHGGEGKVLFGMRRALRGSVRHVYVELHPTALLVDCTVRDVLDVLRDAGFTLFEVNRFRAELPPTLTEVTQDRYEELADESQWSSDQVSARRMIYGSR